VLSELDALCELSSEYAFLQEEKLPGGYHDHVAFRKTLRERLLDWLEDEFRQASGLVDETRYTELFDRYVTHVSFWVKKEKLRNPMTGQYEDPDERLMNEVETLLGSADKPEDVRNGLINSIAAWAIDHPEEPIAHHKVFKGQLRRLREAVFGERRSAVAKLCRDALLLLKEDGAGLDAARRAAAQRAVDQLKTRFGYDDSSASDVVVALVRERLAPLLS